VDGNIMLLIRENNTCAYALVNIVKMW